MEKKIINWLNEGIIDESAASKMLADIEEDKLKNRRSKINITIYTIAVILIGTAVITFIAANDWVLELLNNFEILKILLMTILTFASLWGGYKLAYEKKNYPRLGDSLIVLSSILIGATYALIGQIYNINANSSFLMFIWLLSILPIAYYFNSYTINIISIILAILGTIFFYAELSIDNLLVWTIFIPVLCGALLYTIGNIPIILKKHNKFSLAYKITGALPIFITLLILTCSVEHSYNITSPYYLIPLALLILLNFINYLFNKEPNMILKIESISLISILLMLLLLLSLPSVNIPTVMITANLIIVLMVSFGFNYGYKFENPHIICMTNWILTIYLTVNYCKWGWSFFDKSLFFFIGGVCLLALGLYLENKRKRVIKKEVE